MKLLFLIIHIPFLLLLHLETSCQQTFPLVDTLSSYEKQVTIPSGIINIDSILITNNNLTTENKAELLVEKAQLYAKNSYYSTAINLYNQAFELYRQTKNNDKKQIDILFAQSKLYDPSGAFDKSIANLFYVLKLAQNKYPQETAKTYTNLGYYYSLLDDTNSALEYLDSARKIIQSIELSEKEDVINELKFNLHNITAGFYSMSSTDSTLYHLNMAEKYADNNVLKMQIIYQNQAALHTYLENYDKAEVLFNKAIVLMDDEYKKLLVLCNLAELQNLKNNYKKSLKLYDDAYKMSIRISATYIQSHILRMKADIYAKNSDFKKAYSLISQSESIKKTNSINENEEKSRAIKRDFDLFKIEKEKELYEYKNKTIQFQLFKKNIFIILSLICLCASVVISFIIYRRFKIQNSHKDELSSLLTRKISEKNERLLDSRIETDKKSRELTTNAATMAKTYEILSDILPQIVLLKHQIKSSKNQSTLYDIEMKLKSLNTTDKWWDNFKFQFEHVHPSFSTNLNKTFPTLTAGEHRICTFIVLNMNTKDIAILINRSTRTIDTIKFRIRKKMNIPSNISTLSFLLSLTSSLE